MGLRDDNGALEGDGAREVERALRLERAKTRAWLHDRPLQMLELIAAGGYHDDADAAWLRHLAGKAADELRAFVEGDLDEPADGLGGALRTVIADAELLGGEETYELLIGRLQAEPAPEDVQALAAATWEALTNVRKHARATRVVVTCEATARTAKVTIADDGVGVAFDRLAAGTGVRLSLRHRMQRAGGSAELAARPGGGTRVTLEVPVRVAGARRRATA